MNKIMIYTIVIVLALVAFFFFNRMSADGEDRFSSQEILQQVKDNPGVIIDVRSQAEFDAGHLADVDFQFDFLSGEFESKLDSLDKSKTYYLYCRSGNRSGRSAKLMREMGFEKVYNIGGYDSLISAGFDSN